MSRTQREHISMTGTGASIVESIFNTIRDFSKRARCTQQHRLSDVELFKQVPLEDVSLWQEILVKTSRIQLLTPLNSPGQYPEISTLIKAPFLSKQVSNDLRRLCCIVFNALNSSKDNSTSHPTNKSPEDESAVGCVVFGAFVSTDFGCFEHQAYHKNIAPPNQRTKNDDVELPVRRAQSITHYRMAIRLGIISTPLHRTPPLPSGIEELTGFPMPYWRYREWFRTKSTSK